jgi:UDPglucose 6-dehydrogenase
MSSHITPASPNPEARPTNGPVVGFAGMTYLDIVSAIAAARGFRVIGHDAETSLIRRLDRQDLPIPEPDLDRLVAANQDRISSSATATDLSDCDIVFIAADVPTDDEGASELAAITALIDRISLHIGDGAVLVVLGQVRPGFTHSVSTMPRDRLIYQVETLIFGRAIERALTPQRFIAGCADPRKSATREAP